MKDARYQLSTAKTPEASSSPTPSTSPPPDGRPSPFVVDVPNCADVPLTDLEMKDYNTQERKMWLAQAITKRLAFLELLIKHIEDYTPKVVHDYHNEQADLKIVLAEIMNAP